MDIRIESSLDKLQQLRDTWNALAEGIPFRSADWLLTWWKHFGGDHELFVALITDGDEIVGIAPWYRSSNRSIHMLGSGEVCSDFLSVLCRADQRKSVVQALAHWQADNTELWDLAVLDTVLDSDPAVNIWVEELTSRGLTVHRQTVGNCWRIALHPTWDEYLGILSKSRRKHFRRALKHTIDSGQVTVQRAETTDDFVRCFDTLVTLHQKRWNSVGEPGCFANPRFSAFLHEAGEKLLPQGKLSLFSLETEAGPIAAAIDLLGDDTVYCYQSGLDPDAYDFGPLCLLNCTTIRNSIERGFQYVDFLRGDEEYKRHCRAQPASCSTVRIIPAKTVPLLKHKAYIAGVTVKSWVKSNLLSAT